MATFLATLGRVLWRVAEANNLDPIDFFEDNGLDPKVIEVARARFPFEKLCKAWQSLAVISEKTHIGLEAAEHYRPTDFHALGVTFLASKDLLEALRRTDRYEKVLNSNIDFEVVEEQHIVHFICESLDTSERTRRPIEDMRHALILDLARTGVGKRITPVEVGFTYSQPVYMNPYRQMFGCPLRFNTARPYITFSKSDAVTPFTARNADLAIGNDEILHRLLNSLAEQDLPSRVKQLVAKSLPSGLPTESEIASSMLTSPRTLQRHLADQQTSFKVLVNEVREELAKRYLSDKSIPITEVSYLVGFSDVSAFSRAFKRWTGSSPAVYRG